MALDVINKSSSVFHPTHGLKYILFSQNSKKGIWSAYIGQATTPYALTSAIPLLLDAGTLNCWVFPPGPNRTSLDNLATPGSPKVSMLTPSLVRTLVQHVTQCSRTPVLKPSSNSGLPIAWITEPATDPSQQKEWKSFYIKATIQLFPKFWEHG